MRSPIVCDPSCWTPVSCPECGSDLPPRGRSVAPGVNIPTCCDEARINPQINFRHLWSEDEAQDYADMMAQEPQP